jgi:2-polyprenyl-3-methyl-5-hydroxy-6-metoxy-1,4-benzoquinol methylase
MVPLLNLVQRVSYLEAACRDRRVLHLGCTNWPYTSEMLRHGSLLHTRLQAVARDLHGVDADQHGLDALAALGMRQLHRGDLEHLEDVPLDGTFDVIVAGEIIEHLANPGLFLRGVQRFLRRDSTLIITTVNAYCGFRMVQYALRGRGGEREPVHPDHVAYYSYATLSKLVTRATLETRRFCFYDLGHEHRMFVRGYVRWTNAALTRLWPQLADGVILECGLPASPASPASLDARS